MSTKKTFLVKCHRRKMLPNILITSLLCFSLFILMNPLSHSNKAKAPHVWLNTSETEDVVLISKEEEKGR